MEALNKISKISLISEDQVFYFSSKEVYGYYKIYYDKKKEEFCITWKNVYGITSNHYCTISGLIHGFKNLTKDDNSIRFSHKSFKYNQEKEVAYLIREGRLGGSINVPIGVVKARTDSETLKSIKRAVLNYLQYIFDDSPDINISQEEYQWSKNDPFKTMQVIPEHDRYPILEISLQKIKTF